MKRALAALAIMMVAGITWSVAYGQALVGNTEYLEVEFLMMWICIVIAGMLLLWIKIPEWARGIKAWACKPKWRR